jgi:hypothetical protein
MSGGAGSPRHAVQLTIHENGAHGVTRPTNERHRRHASHIEAAIVSASETTATTNAKFAGMNRSRRRQLAGIKMERVDTDHSGVELRTGL